MKVCHSNSLVSGAVRHCNKELALTKPPAATEPDCCGRTQDSEAVVCLLTQHLPIIAEALQNVYFAVISSVLVDSYCTRSALRERRPLTRPVAHPSIVCKSTPDHTYNDICAKYMQMHERCLMSCGGRLQSTFLVHQWSFQKVARLSSFEVL